MPRLSVQRSFVAVIALTTMLAACGAAGASPSVTAVPVRSADDAVARVIAGEPRLAGIQRFDTGVIGQPSRYTVEPASGVGAFLVTVRVGWGDCEAGCIDEHSWVYAVTPDGAVSVVSEAGPPVPPGAWPSPLGTGRTGITGIAEAGPVCPVETVPPDPGCAARPVPNAVIVVRDGGASEVARVVTGADGAFFVEVPPGDYLVEPQAVEGLLGTAGSQGVTVVDGMATAIQLAYDTGIR